MKFVHITILLLILVSQVLNKKNKSHSKKSKKTNLKSKKHKKQVQVVVDKSGFGSDLGVVIRKNPTAYTINRLGQALIPPPQQTRWFMNSNTSNGPNVGTLGRNPEIVNPRIIFHNKGPVTAIRETPAHVGWRYENEAITSLNKLTGKVEQNNIQHKIPIYGQVEDVKRFTIDSYRPYDLTTRRFGKELAQVSEIH